MFRPSLLAGCGLALALLIVSPASAQLGGPRLQLPSSVQTIFLLRMEPVQKELKLSDEQAKTITEVASQMQSEAMEIMSGLQDLDPEERQKEMPSLMKLINEKGKELQTKIDATLDAKQAVRIKELSLQRRGPGAFEDVEVLAALKITPEQIQKLLAIREEAEAKGKEIIAALTSGGDQGAIREKMQALQKELGDKALAVLTDEQKAAFEKMKGAKFDFPQGGRRGPF